ncbi:amino acid adenylation domain-containing protein [Photorhabdus bodei]|uniref:amino acid adenylation domain-containing protein n=1 Tax=Photorhabdus bodei TaxID=2029681 RepID=UPI001E488082|nr:amino acid adenylation domain-containing protein [Photorhabdus bodei]MCC8465799.1 amino acid adenylation domain-containing protein [Photorhabdus bodei]
MQSTLPIIKWRNILKTGQYRKYDISSAQPANENWITLNNIKLPASFQRKECLPGLLFSHVRSTPWATAVIHGEEQLSYLEMAIGSVHLACYLQNLGCLAGDCVGIFVEPSIEQMIGVWGTLFAGGAYLPLSHDYPEERLRYMIHDSNLKMIFTQEKLKEKLVRLVAENIHIVTLEDVEKSFESSAITNNTLHDYLSPDNLAYVIYTSGSTGKPKGVMIEHRSIVNQMCWLNEKCDLNIEKTIIQKTPISFDAAQWEILSVSCGSRVIISSSGTHRNIPQLIDLIIRHNVTTLQCVPTLLQALIDNHQFRECHTLRQIFIGAESLSRKLATQCIHTLPNCLLINMYGPAECTINASVFLVNHYPISDEVNSVPIGKPVSNTEFFILDHHYQLASEYEIGEIYIAGTQVARGYLNRQDLTEKHFLEIAIPPNTQKIRLYRTGDLAYWDKEGNAHFAGRKDNQIKVRGMRVELEEIKNAIEVIDQVKHAAILAEKDPQHRSTRLTACIELADETIRQQAKYDITSILRSELSKTLPDYMLPDRFLFLDTMPLTSSGKIDFDTLQVLVSTVSHSPQVLPSTSTETQIVKIWEEVLTRESISTEDDFFALGGNSLIAVHLIQRLNEEFALSLPLHTLFEAATVKQLAKIVEGEVTRLSSRLACLQEKDAGLPVFCWPGLGGYPMNLHLLATQICTDRSFYGIQAYGINEGEVPYSTIAEMVIQDITEIKKLQPTGPYTLWGYSFGSVLAFEAAYQLERAGEHVEKVVLIAPGLSKIKYHVNSTGTENGSTYQNNELISLLFSVFAGTSHSSALNECLANVIDEQSFVSFVHKHYPTLAPTLIVRIARIVIQTYGQKYSATELQERIIKAPITVFNARDDAVSFIEEATPYLKHPPENINLNVDHFEVLKESGVNELARFLS